MTARLRIFLSPAERQLSKSGLPFYGLAAYNNHLPLDHPDNTAAVAWLMGDDSSVEANETAAAEGGDARLSPASVSRHVKIPVRIGCCLWWGYLHFAESQKGQPLKNLLAACDHVTNSPRICCLAVEKFSDYTRLSDPSTW